MSAPVRKHHRVTSAKGVFTQGTHFNSRSKIETDLKAGDMAMAYGSDTVKILKKYNCSAMVEYSNKNRTVVNFDNLEKCK